MELINKSFSKLTQELAEGKVTDEQYLERVKAFAYTNLLADPTKATVKRGLEAIKLSIEKEKLGVQKSESLRNWMKLISGKPDKENAEADKAPREVVEGETVEEDTNTS